MHHSSRTPTTIATILALVASTSSTRAVADVWVVDAGAGPGADFAAIQDAVDSAAEGDTVLVRAGSYGDFTIDGLSLTVAAEAGATVDVGQARVQNLAAAQSASLRGLSASGMTLVSLVGSAWVEDCVVSGAAFVVEDCTQAALIRCELYGSEGTFVGPDQTGNCIFFASGSSGGIFRNSTTLLDHCTVRGGSGWFAPACWMSGDDGPGIVLDGGVLFATGSTIETGLHQSCPSDEPTLILKGSDPIAYLHDTSVWVVPSFFCPGIPDPADAIDVQSGQVLELAGDAHGFAVDSPVREGDAVALTLEGESGETAFVAVAAGQQHTLQLALVGALLLDASLLIVDVAALPASGTLAKTLPGVQLAPGLESLPLYLQAAFLGPHGLALGPASSLLLLDSAF